MSNLHQKKISKKIKRNWWIIQQFFVKNYQRYPDIEDPSDPFGWNAAQKKKELAKEKEAAEKEKELAHKEPELAQLEKEFAKEMELAQKKKDAASSSQYVFCK